MIPTLHQLIKETLTLRTSDAEGGGRERGSAGAMVGILNGVVSHTCFGFLRCAFYMLDVKAFRHQALLENNTGLARPISTSEDTTAQNDYQIRLTGGIEEAFARRNEDAPAPAAEYPPGWYDQHRQVPPYRPVNRNLDLADRPWGSNGIESTFVYLMMNGCWLQGIASWLWRGTGGRVNKSLFRAKVGGEI